MSRYVLTFTKKGNMRFISHLDLQRLFRRVLYRANIPVSFSQGFNPHPITNVVQPLSLGFESECDYFEFESKEKLLESSLCDRLNQALPEGIKFTACKEIPHEKRNLSSVCEYALYKVFIPEISIDEKDIKDFISQKQIFILKRDKKTKEYVEKDIHSWIYSIEKSVDIPSGTVLDMILRAAPNESLNPTQLCDSFFKYLEVPAQDIRVIRMDLLYKENGKLISLFNREI